MVKTLLNVTLHVTLLSSLLLTCLIYACKRPGLISHSTLSRRGGPEWQSCLIIRCGYCFGKKWTYCRRKWYISFYSMFANQKVVKQWLSFQLSHCLCLIWPALSSVQCKIWPKTRPARWGHLTFVSKRLSAVGNKGISQFFDTTSEPHSRVIAFVDSTQCFSVVVVLYSYIVEYAFV